MYTQYVVAGVLVVALLAGYVVWRITRARQRSADCFIGYGCVFRWIEGRIVVVSRLIDSPCGRAGVAIGDVWVRWGTIPILHDSAESFVAWHALHRPQLGEERLYTFESQKTGDEYTVTLVAESIQGPIPVYAPIPEHVIGDWRYITGMAFCNKTGQLIGTYRPSDVYIEWLLHS